MALPVLRNVMKIARNSSCILSSVSFSSTTNRFAAQTKYTQKHEWVKVENGVGTVGITNFAAAALGDIVYVELPDLDKAFTKGSSIGAVESVKAASDIYSPISGTVVEINETLQDTPGLINKSPEGDGWIARFKVSDASELDSLLDAEQYEAFKKENEDSH